MTTNPKRTAQPSPPSPPEQTSEFAIPPRLDELYSLDAQIAQLRKGDPHDGELAALLGRRARARLEFGFSDLAVQDLKEARKLRSLTRAPVAAAATGTRSPALDISYVDDARLAEALRVDARDRLLSKTSAPELFRAVDASLDLFQQALTKLAASRSPDPKHLAWVHAHRGGALTMHYWITISENPSAASKGFGDEVFREADMHFERALGLDPGYAWAHRFRAHLHALRGNPGDFEFAIAALQSAEAIEQGASSGRREAQAAAAPAGGAASVEAAGEVYQSSFQRSLAMLFSYVAVQSDSAAAAHQSIAAGLRALARDPDELHAPHSIAASLFWLAHHGPEAERAKHAAYLRPAIATAFLHARNAASRASGVLASLALMEGLLDDGDVVEAAAKAQRVLDGFVQMGIPADLETRAFSYRTPSVALLAKHLGAAHPARSRQVDELRANFEEMLQALTARLAIPRPQTMPAPGAAAPLP